MTALRLLEAIEAESSTNAKAALIAQADEILKTLLQYALDPYRTYGVKDIPLPLPAKAPIESTTIVDDDMMVLEELLERLQNRRLVGNEAREEINNYLSRQPPAHAKWFHRVLLKDLNIGIGATVTNKVFPGLIPAFKIQLAEDAKGKAPKIQYPIWVDYKLDGIRCIAIKEGACVTLYSRKGHVISTMKSVEAALLRSNMDFVLDGELMGKSWNDSQAAVFSTVNLVDSSATFYNVFDAMTPSEWKAKQTKSGYEERRAYVNEVVRSICHTQIRSVGGKMVKSEVALLEFYKEALMLGHEGIMIKDPRAHYSFKRSKAIIKMKPHETWESAVIGWEHGDATGKWANGLGAFLIRIKEDGAVTKVGGGYTDEMREQFMADGPDSYTGRIMEVKGQELTPDGSIRFPVFVRWRSPEDVSP